MALNTYRLGPPLALTAVAQQPIFRLVEVLIDDSKEWGDPQFGETLGQVLESIRTKVESQRRVISIVLLDGQDLNRAQQDALAEKKVEGYQSLQIRTLDPFDLSKKTLAELTAHLNKMEEIHKQAATLIRGGNYDEALKMLGSCFSGWEVVVAAVRDISQLMGASLTEFRVKEKSVEHWIQKLQEILSQFRAAFDVKDVVTIADVADHELIPAIDTWKRILNSLTFFVTKKNNTSSS